MKVERAYDFRGTHLPIYLEFAGEAGQLLVRKQRVVPFGPGLALAQPLIEHVLEGEEHLANLEIGIAQDQPACIGIHAVHGRPLTGAFLRSLAVAAIVTEVATRNTFRVFRTARGRYVGLHYSEAFEGMVGFGDGLEELRADVGQKRRALTPKFLEEVARVYREAAASRLPPAKAVLEQLGGPGTRPETARRWIARAREDGHLGKAPKQGKRGEQRGGK